MKFLKLGFFSLLAILAVSVFLTSCEQEVVENIPNLEEEIGNNQIPEGRFVAELNLQDESSLEDIALISVSTNNEEIYAQFIAANFKAKLTTSNDLEKLAAENVEDIDVRSEQDESLLNTDEHFFTVKILEEYVGEDKPVQYTFGDELLAVVKKYKAKTFFQVSSEEGDALNSRYSVFRNAFTAYGDGGNIRTKLRIGIDYCGSYSSYDDSFHNTNTGFYNYYTFKTCKWPWNTSAKKRYTTFTVTQDVLRRYSRWNTDSCKKC